LVKFGLAWLSLLLLIQILLQRFKNYAWLNKYLLPIFFLLALCHNNGANGLEASVMDDTSPSQP
jgi:hypothetical protein